MILEQEFQMLKNVHRMLIKQNKYFRYCVNSKWMMPAWLVPTSAV